MITYLFSLLILIFLISYLLLNLYNLWGLFWLLSAMSTPTPVSSLLHSLTIVSMGVYLKYKWNIEINNKIYIISLILALFSFNFYDIKKLLALSTSYNISLVFLSSSLSSIGIIHILNHGLFKSLLFLLSGYIIHDNIDLRLLSIHLNPYLYKLFLFLFLPLPFIFLSLSKDYIFLSSSFSLFLIFLFFNYFYFLMGKYLYIFFLNFPNFNYYLRSSTSLPIIISLTIFIMISIKLPYNYTSYYIDLLPFLFMMNRNIYIINLIKHFDNLFLRSYLFLFK